MASTRHLNNRCIDTEDDVREGVRALRRKCEIMRRVHDAAGQPPLRRDVSGFEGLARIIVGQQVSVASAAAIWGRFQTVVQPVGASQVLLLTDENFRTAGLSRPKIRTLRAVAEAVSRGELNLDDLAARTDDQIRDALMAVSGIGPWTADVFLLFCLGRADAFAAGDLALQIAAQHAFELDARPDAAELVALAERWRPWRGVAARLLWAYYRTVKSAKSGVPV